MGQKVRRKEIVSPRVVYRASQVLSMPGMTGRMLDQNLAWHDGRLFDGASRIVHDASQPSSCYSSWHEVGGRWDPDMGGGRTIDGSVSAWSDYSTATAGSLDSAARWLTTFRRRRPDRGHRARSTKIGWIPMSGKWLAKAITLRKSWVVTVCKIHKRKPLDGDRTTHSYDDVLW